MKVIEGEYRVLSEDGVPIEPRPKPKPRFNYSAFGGFLLAGLISFGLVMALIFE